MDEEAQELDCPVCYEGLSDSARSLSCGHRFCHDCLVRTFLNSSPYGATKRDTIICPVCRHLTFITKFRGFSTGAKKTLEVPSVPASLLPGGDGGAVGRGEDDLGSICRRLRQLSCRLCRQKLVCPVEPSEVFIISDSGRPMTETDVIDIGTSSVPQQNYSSSEQRVCTISCCLLILMITFTLMALVAATLPWVLLA